MKKGATFLFFRVFFLIILFMVLNAIIAAHASIGLTGFSIESLASESISYIQELRLPEFYFFIVQWSILFLLLLFSAAHDLVLVQKKNSAVPEYYSVLGNKTDLDVLYEMLQKEKKMPVSAISKKFKVSIEIAFAWCKILESGELAEIVYPGFGEPLLKIKEEKSIENIQEPPKEKTSDAIEKGIKISKNQPHSFFSRLKKLFHFKRRRKTLSEKNFRGKIYAFPHKSRKINAFILRKRGKGSVLDYTNKKRGK